MGLFSEGIGDYMHISLVNISQSNFSINGLLQWPLSGGKTAFLSPKET